MRLIDAKTLELKEFFGEFIPKYAILSHTWGDQEVTYQELSCSNAETKAKARYRKIRMAASQALKDLCRYVWVDTCCIDKTSSAELSEAINSMYHWYQQSYVCYAYLADVQVEAERNEHGELSSYFKSGLRRSRWFTRGWTLQELIAPRNVVFLNHEWHVLGSKSGLRHMLSNITGIHLEALENRYLAYFSVAQRMSWASGRQTTRREDIAYCLLGIFDVNMPLLYGEGEKAFIRLQEEIMKISDDHSLFAWYGEPKGREYVMPHSGLLAPSPSCFSQSQNIVPITGGGETMPYSMTNKGLHIQLRTRSDREDPGTCEAVLECMVLDNTEVQPIIRLQCLSDPAVSDQFARISLHSLDFKPKEKLSDFSFRSMYIRPRQDSVRSRWGRFRVFFPNLGRYGIELSDVHPRGSWDSDDQILDLTETTEPYGSLVFVDPEEMRIFIQLGLEDRMAETPQIYCRISDRDLKILSHIGEPLLFSREDTLAPIAEFNISYRYPSLTVSLWTGPCGDDEVFPVAISVSENVYI